MKLMTMKQYMNMSKPALIRKITKTLRAMPKVKLARLCYNITKSKLPRLKTTTTKRMIARKRQKDLGMARRHMYLGEKIPVDYTWLHKTGGKRKTKRKFSRKQLAAQRLFAKRAKSGKLQQIRSLKRAGF